MVSSAMPSHRYFEPLRHRDFALLWSGQAVSQLGDGVFTVTLAIEALRLDQRAIGLSYVLAARLLPAVLFTLAGGVLVDRVPRRVAMLASDLGRGAAVAWLRTPLLAFDSQSPKKLLLEDKPEVVEELVRGYEAGLAF